MSTAVIHVADHPATDYLPPVDPKAVEQAMLIGDLAEMSSEQRIAYYVATCRSLGLNPLTKPFQALKDDDGKLRLYPDKGCAEQLRKRDKVSTKVLGREILDGLYIVTVQARTPDGREEEAQGIVPLVKAKGRWEDYEYRGQQRRRFKPEVGTDGQEVLVALAPAERANAMKRAETQAKRRATLAICGLGMPDYDADPESPAHPQAFPERPALPNEASKDLDAHITDLFGDEVRQEASAKNAQEGPQQPAGATQTPTLDPQSVPNPAPATEAAGGLKRDAADPGASPPPAGRSRPSPQERRGATNAPQHVSQEPAPSGAPDEPPEGASGATYTVDPETGQLLGPDGKPLPNLMAQGEDPSLFGGNG